MLVIFVFFFVVFDDEVVFCFKICIGMLIFLNVGIFVDVEGCIVVWLFEFIVIGLVFEYGIEVVVVLCGGGNVFYSFCF